MSGTAHSILDMVANLAVVMWACVCTHVETCSPLTKCVAGRHVRVRAGVWRKTPMALINTTVHPLVVLGQNPTLFVY